jgi:hypothetical protein
LRDAGWKPVSLGRDEGDAIDAARKRNAEVERWKEGGHVAAASVAKRQQQGTLGALIARYRKEVLDGTDDRGRRVIAKSTAKTYGTGLLRLEKWAGKHPLSFVTPARVVALRKAMMAPAEKGGIGHHAAHQTLKMGRTLFKFAIECDLIEKGKNPFTEFGLAAPDPRDVIWSPPARELLVQTAYDQGRPSVALAILLGFAVGQREQDLLALTQRQYVAIPEHKMQPEDYRVLAAMAPDGIPMGIRVRQQKTKAWVEVPIVGLVRWAAAILLDDARGAASQAALYAGEAGQTRFQRDFAEIREWAVAAARFEDDDELAEEIETLHFRDLRRTCVVYLGELGLDAHLIAAITGHDIDETQRILRVYMPRTTGRAARAIALASAREAKEAGREKSA